MTEETRRIITNKHMIAVNQDKAGYQPLRIWKREVKEGGTTQLWFVALHDNAGCVLLLNSAETEQNIDAQFEDILMDYGAAAWSKTYVVEDLWDDGKSIGQKSVSLGPMTLKPHAVRVFRISEAK
jgi:alpha-galactosidase